MVASSLGAILNETKNPRDTDLDRLSRLKALSWLSTSELTLLVRALAVTNFGRDEIILREAALASEAHILRLRCSNYVQTLESKTRAARCATASFFVKDASLSYTPENSRIR